MSASSIFTSMTGPRQSSAAYGRLTVGTKPQRKCHHRINRSIAIPNLLDRRKAMSTNFRPLRNIRKRPAAVPEEKEKYEAIEQALQKLAREGQIVDTGRRRWSKRTRSYQIVWAKAPGASWSRSDAGLGPAS